MSSTDTQSQILAQLMMLTNQVSKLQAEVTELRCGAPHHPVSASTSEPEKVAKKAKKAKKVKPEGTSRSLLRLF